MQIQEAVEVCVTQKYADFEGVATRSELWFFYLFLMVIESLIAVSVPSLSGIFAIVMLAPSLAVGTRRLHDINRSGWWQLLWIVPVIGIVVLVIFWAQPGKSSTAPLTGATPTAPS